MSRLGCDVSRLRDSIDRHGSAATRCVIVVDVLVMPGNPSQSAMSAVCPVLGHVALCASVALMPRAVIAIARERTG